MKNFLLSPAGKFLGGAASTGAAALTMFLAASGCQVSDLKTFGTAALIAVAGGIFHAIKNNYPPTPPVVPA